MCRNSGVLFTETWKKITAKMNAKGMRKEQIIHKLFRNERGENKL